MTTIGKNQAKFLPWENQFGFGAGGLGFGGTGGLGSGSSGGTGGELGSLIKVKVVLLTALLV